MCAEIDSDSHVSLGGYLLLNENILEVGYQFITLDKLESDIFDDD